MISNAKRRAEGPSYAASHYNASHFTGLGGMVAMFTVIKMVSGAAPSKIVNRHTIKIKKVITMEVRIEKMYSL